MSNVVYNEEQALACLRAHKEKFLTYQKKKTDDKKGKSKTLFIHAMWHLNLNNVNATAPGWFSFTDAVVSRGIVSKDKVTPGSSDQYESSRVQLRVKSSSTKAFGTFLTELEPYWQALVESMVAEKVLDIKGKQIHSLIALKVPDDADENAGAAIDDPTIKLKIDFTKFPENFPIEILKNKQKTIIEDVTKPYTDAQGKIRYEEATVPGPNGQRVKLNEDNVHEFVRSKAQVVYCRVYAPSIIQSAAWISLPMTASLVRIAPAPEDGFSDDFQLEETAAVATVAAVATAATVATVAPPVEVKMPEGNNHIPDINGAADFIDDL